MNLATTDFWEHDYYRGIKLPARPDPTYPYERCLMRTLELCATVSGGARVLEIGCAPARWLLWYAERFGAQIAGLESSQKGVELSRQNLAAADVAGDIYEGDFLSDDLALGQFDLVLSLGVIEHFEDLAAAFTHHVRFVGANGQLVIGMPNFRGLIGFFQRWADPDYLELHNRRAMDPDLYRRLAPDNGMRLDRVYFLDGIDPDMVRVGRLSARLALMPFRLWRRLRLSDHVNGRAISSSLLLTFTRVP